MDYFIALSYFMKIGPALFKRGLEYCGSINDFYNAPEKTLILILKEKLAQEFIQFRNSFDLKKTEANFEKQNIIAVSLDDPRQKN
jgi:hypothetical protein